MEWGEGEGCGCRCEGGWVGGGLEGGLKTNVRTWDAHWRCKRLPKQAADCQSSQAQAVTTVRAPSPWPDDTRKTPVLVLTGCQSVPRSRCGCCCSCGWRVSR
jgi:hypothetical protein